MDKRPGCLVFGKLISEEVVCRRAPFQESSRGQAEGLGRRVQVHSAIAHFDAGKKGILAMLSREHSPLRRHRRFAQAAALLSLGLTLLRPVGAAPASLCPDHPIRFAHYEFGLVYSSGYGGIDDDVQKELMRRSACSFEVSLQPRARTWADLKSGYIDMAGSGIQTAERDTFAWFFPYIVEDNVIVLGPRVPRSMQSLKAFLADPQLSLGGVRSYRYSPNYDAFVDQLIQARRHHEAADPGALFRMFEVQRFDAFITNPLLYLYYVKMKGLPNPQRIEDWDPAGATPSGLVLSKKSFTEAQALQWGVLIKGMLADGTIEAITAKHAGAAAGPKVVYRAPK